jgi:hypothetical protein
MAAVSVAVKCRGSFWPDRDHCNQKVHQSMYCNFSENPVVKIYYRLHWCMRMTTRTESTDHDKGVVATSSGSVELPTADRQRKRIEALEYVRSMLGELNDIARHERFDMIAYLLQMACVEAAEMLARETAPRRRRTSRV